MIHVRVKCQTSFSNITSYKKFIAPRISPLHILKIATVRMQSPAVSDEEVRPTDDSFDELAERRHFESVCRTMLKYADFAEMGIERRQEHLARLSPDMARMLPSSVWSKLPEMFDAVAENQAFLQCVVEFQDYRFSDRAPGAPLEFPLSTERIAATQMHRNQAILHSLAREWSEEGRRERDSCFAPLLDELQRVLPVSEDNLFRQRVLVPGAGLARLAVETAARGYATQANEYSMFMLTASHFVLNGITDDKSFQIFPWLDRLEIGERRLLQ